jgi:Xaa-Pro aminopeptidase
MWLEEQLKSKKSISELDIVDKMFDVRKDWEHFYSLSFSTIAGFGSNGAIVHYHPEKSTNKLVDEPGLLLIDSGGQYFEGTTDITRTLSIGAPSLKMKEHYTAVLKGHIALANARFPKGTTGAQLDILARQYIWNHGLDYNHGTGHGVGSFLNVHEGPQRISKLGTTALMPGMLLSNEPGIYLEGFYGIRIENVMVVIEKENGFLGFETLTLVPFDHSLIKKELLTFDEIGWITSYYERIKKELLSYLKDSESHWLEQKCVL